MKNLIAQHEADRAAWRAEKANLEANHSKSLADRDANLAALEAEHKRKAVMFAEMHAQTVKKNKDAAEAAMALKHTEMRNAESKYNADIQALRDEMSKNLQDHLNQI